MEWFVFILILFGISIIGCLNFYRGRDDNIREEDVNTTITEEAWNQFKEQYKKEHGRKISNDEALAICLFENSVLHTQNFIFRLSEIKELDFDTKIKLAEDIMSYLLALIFIYLGHNNITHSMVLNEYKKFLKTNSGTTDKKQNEILFQVLYDKLSRNIMWLSSPFENKAIIHKILSGISYLEFRQGYEVVVEKMVSDVALSMKHFGIVL